MNERDWEKNLNVRTAGRSGDIGARDMPYEPTPYCVLERLKGSGFILSSDRVVDYGSGKGRVAFFLAREIGCHVTGIEKSERLTRLAEDNLRAFSEKDRVRLIRAAAEGYSPTEEQTFFFFNPFSEAVFRAVYGRILRAWFENPIEFKLLLYYPADEWTLFLEQDAHIELSGSIDCRDLFDGCSPRERVDLWKLPALQ